MTELRSVRADDPIRAFERAGGIVRSGKGDHVNIKMPNGQIVTIPRSREPIKVGLLKAALKKAGISDEQFAALLKGRTND